MTEERAKIGFPPKTTPYEDWCKIITKLEAQLTEKDKQIEELEKKADKVVISLKADCNEIGKRAYELEAQIEKMKCCYNCYRFNGCSLQRPCRNYEDWKLNEE